MLCETLLIYLISYLQTFDPEILDVMPYKNCRVALLMQCSLSIEFLLYFFVFLGWLPIRLQKKKKIIHLRTFSFYKTNNDNELNVKHIFRTTYV